MRTTVQRPAARTDALNFHHCPPFRRLKEELTPLPTPPGYVNTSPINPDLWARIPSEHLRYAIKTSVKEVLGDYVWLFRKMKGGGGEATKATEEPGGGAAAASASPTPSPSSGTIRPPLTSEEIREASIRAARRAMDLAKDEGLRERLASLSAEGLSLARDCLDEFLRGYQEGKNEEVRAYIEEQMEKEKEFVQKVKRIRSELDGRI
jgi:hypothetical protein